MVSKKIIFQNRYVELETPLPLHGKNHLNFHFDYLTPSLMVFQDIHKDISRIEVDIIAKLVFHQKKTENRKIIPRSVDSAQHDHILSYY